MVLGNITKIIPAQTVKITRLADELILTSDVKVTVSHIRNVTNTRAGPIYTFQWRIREIEVTVALTKDLVTQLETDNQLNANSALTFNNWTVAGLSISGVGGDNTSDVYSAALVDFDPTLAPENGVAQVRIKLLIAGAAT